MRKEVELLVQELGEEDVVRAQQMEKDAKGLQTRYLCDSTQTCPEYIIFGKQYRASERLYFCLRGIFEMDELTRRCEVGENDGSVGNFMEARVLILSRAKELRTRLFDILPKLVELVADNGEAA